MSEHQTPTVMIDPAELQALRSDAERYRWLKSRTCIEDRDGGYTGFYRLPNVDQRNGTGAKKNQFYYSDLDVAIDAAISNKP